MPPETSCTPPELLDPIDGKEPRGYGNHSFGLSRWRWMEAIFSSPARARRKASCIESRGQTECLLPADFAHIQQGHFSLYRGLHNALPQGLSTLALCTVRRLSCLTAVTQTCRRLISATTLLGVYRFAAENFLKDLPGWFIRGHHKNFWPTSCFFDENSSANNPQVQPVGHGFSL
ncbi:hypothetical protein BJY04DRAFT_31952 [Aspergillus karnatakaensis]|uniref:uncharacterized protein n=1 Tax=Aspergillus karnatakaensis TaxID=1810916 RepID=UPI003CCE2E8D